MEKERRRIARHTSTYRACLVDQKIYIRCYCIDWRFGVDTLCWRFSMAEIISMDDPSSFF
jgi:hypothetical protein